MSTIELPASPIAGLRTTEFRTGDEALLQRFFDANPFYFLAINGETARHDEAADEIHGELPPSMPFTKKWVIGYLDADGEVVALVNVVSDLLAANVWHIGTFIVATARFGTGDAQTLYRSIEEWCEASGAQWMRLNVVQGHERAERFWRSRGYVQVSQRLGIAMGQRINTLLVMVKPLSDATLDEYAIRVPRDHADAR